MKRTISLALVTLMLLAATSCNDTASNTGNKPDFTTASSVTEAVTTTESLAQVDPKIQNFAEKLFTKCSHSFVNPLSIKLSNAWYYHHQYEDIIDDHYFTFEFTVENSAGIEQHFYYGNDTIPFKELSEKEISDAGHSLALGSSLYFEENGIKAMQEGEPLDAAAIQEYFLKNY